MKHAIRATRVATVLSCALVAGTTLPHAASASPPAARHPIATVNGIPISQGALDTALAASGQCDSAALRRELKRRLIAWEVLRQAAMRVQSSSPGERQVGPVVVASNEATESETRAAHVIGIYLRRAIHPATVSDAELHRRYRALARASAAHSSVAGGQLPPFDVFAGTLRESVEAERFDEAVHRLAKELIEEANITE
jgi:hypothetical protein